MQLSLYIRYADTGFFAPSAALARPRAPSRVDLLHFGHSSQSDTYLLSKNHPLMTVAFDPQIGYGGVKTLTDASVRSCSGDLKAFKPSIMVGVRE